MLMIVVLLVLGCGGDDDDDSAATTTTSESELASPTETQEVQADAAADKRIAQEAVLVLEDFPSGWQQADEDEESETADCAGVKEARAAVSARASSPSFSEGENTSVQNGVFVYADEAAASEAFAGLVSPETRTCLGEATAEVVAESVEEPGGSVSVGDPETSRVSIEPLGDDREAGRITVPVNSEGIDVDLVVDAIYVRVGRGVAGLLFLDTFSAFDEDLKAELTSKVVRRLSAALD